MPQAFGADQSAIAGTLAVHTSRVVRNDSFEPNPPNTPGGVRHPASGFAHAVRHCGRALWVDLGCSKSQLYMAVPRVPKVSLDCLAHRIGNWVPARASRRVDWATPHQAAQRTSREHGVWLPHDLHIGSPSAPARPAYTAPDFIICSRWGKCVCPSICLVSAADPSV